MKLSDLQRDFQELVFARAASAPLLDEVYPSHRLDAYVDGYPARISEALEETYPRLKAAVSDEEWQVLVEEYSAEFRSPSRNLSEASHIFPEFFSRHPPSREHAALLSLSHLERTIMEVFHARSRTALKMEELAQMFAVDPSQVELRLQDHVQVLDLRAGIFDLWRGKRCLAAEAEEIEHILLYRRGWDVMLESVPPAARDFLASLRKDPSFANACGALSEVETSEGSSPPLHEWLHAWTQRGLFNSTSTEGEKSL